MFTSPAPNLYVVGLPLSVATSEASLVQSGRVALLSASESSKSVASLVLAQACVASLHAAISCAPPCVSRRDSRHDAWVRLAVWPASPDVRWELGLDCLRVRPVGSKLCRSSANA